MTESPKELEFAKRVFCERYPVKVRCAMGPGPNDAKKGTILNRAVRWEDDEVSFEADPENVDRMLKDMRLTDSKPSMIPGAREDRIEGGTALEGDQSKTYRSLVARADHICNAGPARHPVCHQGGVQTDGGPNHGRLEQPQAAVPAPQGLTADDPEAHAGGPAARSR